MIVDVHIDRIDQPQSLEAALNQIPGIVETGLFVNRTDVLIVGTPQGVQTQHVQRT
jgi:ribose 5-phosphate isomerase A